MLRAIHRCKMERSTRNLRGRCHPAGTAFRWCPALFLVASFLGCGFVGPGTPQPPPNITVVVAPSIATVLLGELQTFSAILSNATDNTVTWSVNGVSGGSVAFGTITTSGVYTAPAILPAPDSISVTATSFQDPSKSFTAQVTIASDVTISLSPQSASVELGAVKQFTAKINSAGNPNPSATWNLSGGGCTGEAGNR